MPDNKDKGSVVLFSGGLDSLVMAVMAREYGPVHLLTFEYGQRHWCEIETARKLGVELAPASHEIRNVPAPTGSRLTQLRGKIETAEASVVPGRNMIFMLYGCLYAHEIGAQRVLLGATAEDQEDYIDCRPATHRALELAFDLGIGPGVDLVIPLATHNKTNVCRFAIALGVAELARKTWSCYSPVDRKVPREGGGVKMEPAPCGECPACVKRERAIRESGL